MKSSRMMLFVVVLSLCNIFVVGLGDSCEGEHEYKDAQGNCQICEQCGPGYQPSSHHCGWGTRESSYQCVPCERGTFSTGRDYQYCKGCAPCWNSEVMLQCTATKNAVCGLCNDGFFRPIMSDGKLDEECHQCKENSKHPECEIRNDYLPYIFAGVGGVLLIIIILFLVCCCYERKKITHATKNTDTSKLNFVLKCGNNEDTVNSTAVQLLTDSVENQDCPRDLLEQPPLQQMFVRPGYSPPIMEGGQATSYTTHPTATFPQEPHFPSNYSQRPTGAYDEIHNRSLVTRPLLHGNGRPDSPQSSRGDFHIESFNTDQIESMGRNEITERQGTNWQVHDASTLDNEAKPV
uniref:Uncharacterized protein LOC100176402 n=1 Tax=Phallusia mammillata TaxID=59560 RepID=A0A6F9DGP1_9ASCI|nr:uncharacterized protein LOC100176402 [Phallusia mammillata]